MFKELKRSVRNPMEFIEPRNAASCSKGKKMQGGHTMIKAFCIILRVLDTFKEFIGS